MNKFKVGDLVKIGREFWFVSCEGKIGIIIKENINDDWTEVFCDGKVRPMHRFELLKLNQI